MDACTWCVQEPAVPSNGAGYAKRNGQEIVWEPTGLGENTISFDSPVCWIVAKAFLEKKKSDALAIHLYRTILE